MGKIGIRVIHTVVDKQTEGAVSNEKIINDNVEGEVLAWTDAGFNAPSPKDRTSLTGRLETAKSALEGKNVHGEIIPELKPKIALFVSVHFNDLNTPNYEHEGPYIIAPKRDVGHEGDEILAKKLEEVFQSRGEKRLTKRPDGTIWDRPQIDISGSRDTGTTDVFILKREQNPLRNRVLIELGNLRNPTDRNKVMNPGWRQNWAYDITQALMLSSIEIAKTKKL